MTTEVWVVAGCLFEVSLPANGGRQGQGQRQGRWRWREVAGDVVTLLAEHTEDDRQHFRFRAEAAGARVGTVELRFETDGTADADAIAIARVRIAPERRD